MESWIPYSNWKMRLFGVLETIKNWKIHLVEEFEKFIELFDISKFSSKNLALMTC